MSSEYRRDFLVDRRVIIAPDRTARPHEFVETETVRCRGECPFCEGREAETTAEVDALRAAGTRPGEPGWRVRAVTNKYPFLDVGARSDVAAPPPAGPFVARPACGVHEVLIESPRHAVCAADLSVDETADVLRLYRARLRALRGNRSVRYVQIFKNVGEPAGASIEHLHSQLAALDAVPALPAEELAAARRYFERHSRCAYCDLIAAELSAGVRTVETTPEFVAFCPYASRFAYEVHLLPRRHAASFDLQEDDVLMEQAAVLRRTLVRLESVLGRAAYNLVLRVEPFDSSTADYYHWRWEILPRLVKAAGFEWATGVMVNPTAPEAAAERLRNSSE